MDHEEEHYTDYSSSGDVAEDLSGDDYSSDDGGDIKEKTYKILKEEDIRQLQENHISTVSSILSVSRGLACSLLCQNNWNMSFFDDGFFSDDPIVPKPVGNISQVCKICYEDISNENMDFVAACGHAFCIDCWKVYITTSINDGPGCLTLRCPEPKCKETVGLDMVDRLVSGVDRDRYYQYLCRSYVECNSSNRKWCPAPGCESAIEFYEGEYEYCDVTCDCSYRFCWNCTQESHRPVDCQTVANWLKKNSSEAENTKWILAYTKPCPTCKKPIEKNQGCNHMTCSSCGYHFCWICLKGWRDHAGDAYECNRYNEKVVSEDEKIRMNARAYMERYTHYYERWDSNDKAKKRALLDLDRAKNVHIPRLGEVQKISHSQLKFVIEAWEQIVECRRVLKWTYAYGYYLSIDRNSGRKMDLFEFLQGEAEATLERLHDCAEKEMDKYLKSVQDDFNVFQSSLSCLTSVTKNFFENLVRGLENNLSEVESSQHYSKAPRESV